MLLVAHLGAHDRAHVVTHGPLLAEPSDLFDLHEVAHGVVFPGFVVTELLAAINPSGHAAEDEADIALLVPGEDDAGTAFFRQTEYHRVVEFQGRGLGHSAFADSLPAFPFHRDHAGVGLHGFLRGVRDDAFKVDARLFCPPELLFELLSVVARSSGEESVHAVYQRGSALDAGRVEEEIKKVSQVTKELRGENPLRANSADEDSRERWLVELLYLSKAISQQLHRVDAQQGAAEKPVGFNGRQIHEVRRVLVLGKRDDVVGFRFDQQAAFGTESVMERHLPLRCAAEGIGLLHPLECLRPFDVLVGKRIGRVGSEVHEYRAFGWFEMCPSVLVYVHLELRSSV